VVLEEVQESLAIYPIEEKRKQKAMQSQRKQLLTME